MVDINKKITGQGFFRTSDAGGPTVSAKPVNGARAVAAAFIDVFLTSPRALSKGDLLSKVLAEYFTRFSNHRSTALGLKTSAERMQQLIAHVRMVDLVRNFADIFQQMANKEISDHPEFYRGAFVERNGEITPDFINQPTSRIEENRIAALATMLGMKIKVRVVERLKELPMPLQHNSAVEHPKIVLRLQSGHYTPYLTAKKYFASVHFRPTQGSPAANQHMARSMPEIHEAIDAADKRLIILFEGAYNPLLAMVAAGELNKAHLLIAYIKSLSHSEDLSTRVAYVGVEHGSQAFFDEILTAQVDASKPKVANQEDTVNELIHTLSRMVSLGQIEEETLFAIIEEAQGARAHPGLF